MAIINGYLTLAEYKRDADVDDSIDSDAADDLVIEDLIEEASRFIDEETDRTFYPRVETRYHDATDERELWLDDDLLEVISITNGDDTTISSSDYNLVPRNYTPHYAISIIQSSSETWDLDSSGNSEDVIDIAGIWGYHTNYSQRAWITGSTINESGTFSASDTTLTVTSGSLFDADQIIKIDNEILRVTAVSTADLTVVRGENGSTGATHTDGSTVYIWSPIRTAKKACRAIARSEYKRRFGENTEGAATITGAGVVITPDSIPKSAARIISNLKRRV